MNVNARFTMNVNVRFTEDQYYLLFRKLLNDFNNEYDYQVENDCETDSLNELYSLIEALEEGRSKVRPDYLGSTAEFLKGLRNKIHELEEQQ